MIRAFTNLALSLIAMALAIAAGMLFGLLLLIAFDITYARAHEAPTGWSYPSNCCSNRDCREVPASFVKETWAGYLMTKSNEVIGFGDTRVKDSPDGLIHWCTQGGTDKGRTLCLFMPPRAM